jgi:hypothetical protein
LLTLHVDTAPAGADAKVYYTARHQLDVAGTTLSAFQADVLVTGASAYAAFEQSAFTVDRVTMGEAVAGGYAAYGRARLTAFRQLLLQYGRANRVRGRRTFVPA